MSRTLFALRLLPAILAALIGPPAVARSQHTPNAGTRSTAALAQKPASQQTTTPLYSAPGPLLPEMFAGWQMAGTPQTSSSPQAADSANPAVLQEYGFSRYEAADYTRGSDKLALQATEFGDATGAYGAFTFYRHPNMSAEEIGQGAAFDGNRVLFWSGTVLVEAKFNRITATSAGELRDLSTLLPRPQGNQGTLPTLPEYLPLQHLEPMTVQYAIGPDAYKRSGGVLPVALVDFGRSAEVVTAQYDSLNGTGTLTVINYPTPEIAADRQRAIQAFFATRGTAKSEPGTADRQNAWTSALANSNPAALQSRRSGPLVAVTSGSFSGGTAQQLLQSVHYEATLTISNSGRYVPDTSKLAQIILSVAYLVGIFALIAIVAGVSLGGGRVLLRRMRRKSGQPEDESAEFIRLNLRT